MAIKFDVLNRFTGAVQFTAEIECDEGASVSVKLGLAVRWAVKARADLAGAYLAGAYLAGADLIDGGQRSDGYRFVGSVKYGALMISAGCRYFALPDARSHWSSSRGGTALGDETHAILDHIERVANVRGLIRRDRIC